MVTMLNQAFWKTGSWLLQFQLRSRFRVEVCYIKQWCALNKDTYVDDYESLATNAEAEADADASVKSELNYFATEEITPEVRPKSKHKGKPPLRKTLAYTNRVLFGPLLETSAEKKKRIKAEEEAELEEEGEIESTQRTSKRKKGKKKKKKKKKKSPEIVEPLIWKPENAHLLGLFTGNEPPKYIDRKQTRRVEIGAQDSASTPVVPRSKMLLFKQPSKKDYSYDLSQLQDTSKVYKLHVASWDKEKEGSVSSSRDEDMPGKSNVPSNSIIGNKWTLDDDDDFWSQENKGSVSSGIGEDMPGKSVMSSWKKENEDSMFSSIDEDEVQDLKSHKGSSSSLMGYTNSCSSSDLASENDEIQKSELYRDTSLELEDDMVTDNFSDLEEEEDDELPQETPSLLYIDNTKFSSAPSVLDTERIQNFPLEKTTEPPDMQSEAPTDKSDSILTIGMFDDGYQRLPSVSKILEATMPEANRRVLERWKAKMIRELGEEGFERYRQELFDKGKLLHGCIHSQLTGISPGVEDLPTVQGVWTSISHVLPSIANVAVLESRLVHPYLYYQGAVDCVATYKGMPVLIDWKTSTKPKLTLKSMFDNPLQVVAYLGALNFDSHYQLPHQVQSAMVVVAYDSGLPAHVHILDRETCQSYWRLWCGRLVQFWRQQEVKEPT